MVIRLVIPLVLIAALMLPFGTKAQIETPCNLSLHGKISDAGNGEALPGAVIILSEINKSAVADANGKYHFKNICSGNYTAEVRSVGYIKQKIQLMLNKNTIQNIRLVIDEKQLKDVTVTGVSTNESLSPNESLSARELESKSGEPLGELLKHVPGLTALQTGPSIYKPVIHGMSGNRILILNNGVRLEGQQWGSEHAPEIDPFTAGKVTVIKGAAGVRYGAEAVGGVVLLEPDKLPNTPGINGEVSLVGFSNNYQGVVSGMVEGNFEHIKPLSWRLQSTYKRGGDAKTPDYFINNTGLREVNFSGALGWHKAKYGAEVFFSRFDSDLGIYRESHFGNVNDLITKIKTGEPFNPTDFSYAIENPRQKVIHNLLKAETYIRLNDFGKLELNYAYQTNHRAEFDAHKQFNEELLVFPQLEFEINSHTAEAVLEHQLSDAFDGSIGISSEWQTHVTFGANRLIPNFRSWTGGVFITERWLQPKFHWEAGLRFDRRFMIAFMKDKDDKLTTPEFYFNNISGALGGMWFPNKNWNIKMNFATAWRPPTVNELFSNGVHHGAATFETGDPNLTSETALNFNLTASRNSEKWSFEVGLFYNYILNYILLKPSGPPVQTIRGAFPAFQYTQIDAAIRGVDLSAAYQPIDWLSWRGTLSLLTAENLTENQFLIYMPPTRFSNSLRFEFGKKGRFRHFFITPEVTYTAEQTRTPPDQTIEKFFLPNGDFAPPPKGYALLNIESGFSIFFGKQQLHVGFSVQNVLNTRYRDYLNRFRYFTDETGRNFALRINVPFSAKKNNS